MATYQPPDKNHNRKRNKTGYNIFFSMHVNRLKQTESGVPTERGSIARLVAESWKALTAEEKQFYEREADKHNDANPIEEDENDEEEDRRHAIDFFNHMHAPPHQEMHMVPPGHLPPPQHYYAAHLYGQASYYDYSQHHQRQQQTRGYQGRYSAYDG